MALVHAEWLGFNHASQLGIKVHSQSFKVSKINTTLLTILFHLHILMLLLGCLVEDNLVEELHQRSAIREIVGILLGKLGCSIK